MRAEDVGIEDQPGGGHVLHLDRRGDADAGIVDEDVDRAAVDPLGLLHPVIDLLEIGHVDADDVDFEVFCGGQRGELVGLGAGEVAHRREHPRALPRQQLGRQSPEARGAAGDQHALAPEADVRAEDGLCGARRPGREGSGGGGSGKQRAAVEAHGGSPWLGWIRRGYWLCAILQARWAR